MKHRRRYVIGGIAFVLALILYYVIDYAVVSSHVRKHVQSALSTAIMSIGSMQPSQMNYLAPANARRDAYINLDNRWLVVNPNSFFVKQQIEYNTWLQLNQDPSSPICLLNILSMGLTPSNQSMLVTTDVRFVGPFGIPRTLSVGEIQSVKEFPTS